MTATPGAAPVDAAPARTDARIRDQLLASLERRILAEAAGVLVPTGVRLIRKPTNGLARPTGQRAAAGGRPQPRTVG